MIKHIFPKSISVVLMLLVTQVSLANNAPEQLNIALKLHESGQYNHALPKLLELSTKGEPLAMFVIGDMYANGHGVKLSLIESEKWYVKGVENTKNDIDEEMLGLGIQYYFGDRVIQNYKKAEFWFKKSTKLGNPNGAFSIASLYMEVRNDFSEALKWLEIGAKYNHVESQIWAGQLYALAKNNVVTRDRDKGMYWCQMALNNSAATSVQKKEATSCINKIKRLDAILK